MAKRSTTESAAARDEEPACGPMRPVDGDEPITKDETPEAIVANIMLTCDNDTGVFFFRHQRRLYRRVIEKDG